MPKITISDETMRIIRDNVLPGYGFRQTATQIRKGLWELPVDQDVIDKINVKRVPGEPDDAVIDRLLCAAVASEPN